MTELPRLVDPFARAITYLRVSVTDRCDFRCVYCMAEDMTFVPRKELLALEEIDRLASRSRTRELLPAEELIAEGWAREVIHRIQSERKAANLDYADRIRVRYQAADELRRAIEKYQDHIARETLRDRALPADDTDVDRYWRRVIAANTGVVGDDPDQGWRAARPAGAPHDAGNHVDDPGAPAGRDRREQRDRARGPHPPPRAPRGE